MKNGFIIAALFLLLNLDVGALLLYAKYPSVFETSSAEATVSVPVTDPIAMVLPIPVSETTENVVNVDIIVADKQPIPEVEEPVEMAEIAPDIIPEPEIPAIRHDIMLADRSNFRQDERGWAYEPLGHTRQTMREYGCTVTSVANAITNYDRDYMTPKILNNNLIKARGYTDRGWLKWSAISQATNGKYAARVFSGGNPEAQIDGCLANNEYPVVKIMLRGEVQHWVLVVGRKNGEYMVRDPLEGDRAEHPIPLSSRAKRVHSVRCIGPN